MHGVQAWLSGSLGMMLNKNYGMLWVETQPCIPEQLEKISAATNHTVCVYGFDCCDCCDCVVCTCIDSVGPQKSSLWLSGFPDKNSKYFYVLKFDSSSRCRARGSNFNLVGPSIQIIILMLHQLFMFFNGYCQE